MANYRHGGYEKKYIISKANGKPTDPKADYFVLRLDKDPHALRALLTYANSVGTENLELSSDLHKKLKEYGVEGGQACATIIDGVRFPFFVLQKIKDGEPELKPCPFCGEKRELLPSEALNAKWHNQFTVCCSINANGCGSTSRYADSKQEAIKAWNKRVSV